MRDIIVAMPQETHDTEDYKSLIESDPVMRRYALAAARRASDLRGFALGLYVEAMVAHELAGKLSPGGTDDVDIEWRPSVSARPVRIQVRSCRLRDAPRGSRGSLDVGKSADRSRLGDVWVFAVHTGDDHRKGWKFHVRSANELEAFGPQRRVAVRRLAPLEEWIELSRVGPAVREASGT